MLNLEPIKERLRKATPSPWSLDGPLEGASNRIVVGDGLVVAMPRDHEGHRDAEFIAAAPQDIAALVAEIERLRSWMEKDIETLEFARWKIRDLKAELKKLRAEGGQGV